ncbi:arylesterase [Ekhidna sp.]|uniref:arylesterase n=1 Tax=Ekhidna sp. TaxID=2608089 RepID=UPI003CCC1123
MFLRVQIILLSALFFGCSTSKESESQQTLKKEQSAVETSAPKEEERIILFFGNSITAGYQLDMDQAFPAIIQEKIDSLGLNYKAINAGLSGETSAGGKSRIDWVLRTTPDIFFLELGANDGLRGLPLDETYKNLQDIIDAVKKENPEVEIIIAGMMVPPNLGDDYSKEFQQLFPKLSKENDAIYIPFLLEGVAGNPDLNLRDGIHPTPEGHEIVAETVWDYLKPLLEEE